MGEKAEAMRDLLIISGHPDIENSHANKTILNRLAAELPNANIRRLDILYPDHKIDVEAEQKALLDARVVVFQFPWYWYSMPSLLKAWVDQVLTLNFAYGPEGDKLKGKEAILSFTVGGSQDSYSPLSYNHFTIEQLLLPIQQTIYLTGMMLHPPVYGHRMVYVPDLYNTEAGVVARAEAQAHRLIKVIKESNCVERQIEDFVHRWFKVMDVLPREPTAFIEMLDDHVVIRSREGEFNGVTGFNEWYGHLCRTFAPPAHHTLGDLTLVEQGEGTYEVSFSVQVEGELCTGDGVNMSVDETWLVRRQANGNLKLASYVVTL